MRDREPFRRAKPCRRRTLLIRQIYTLWLETCQRANASPEASGRAKVTLSVLLDPRAAELAAGRRPRKKCGLAAEKIAASRQPGRKKNAA